MIYNILLIVQIVVALGIIGLVLVQHGKGADAGAAFGGGSSGTVFGSAGASNFLSRSTAILAAVFFANSLALAWIVSHSTGEAGSIVDTVKPTPTTQVEKTAPISDVPGGSAVPVKAPSATTSDVPAQSDIPAVSAPAPQKTEQPNSSSDVPVAPSALAPVDAKTTDTSATLAPASVVEEGTTTTTVATPPPTPPVVATPVKTTAEPQPAAAVPSPQAPAPVVVPASVAEEGAATTTVVTPPPTPPVVEKPVKAPVEPKPAATEAVSPPPPPQVQPAPVVVPATDVPQ